MNNFLKELETKCSFLKISTRYEKKKCISRFRCVRKFESYMLITSFIIKTQECHDLVESLICGQRGQRFNSHSLHA